MSWSPDGIICFINKRTEISITGNKSWSRKENGCLKMLFYTDSNFNNPYQPFLQNPLLFKAYEELPG